MCFSRSSVVAFAAVLAVSASPVIAQIAGSPYEPRIAELIIEGKVHLPSVFAANPDSLAIPPEVLGPIQAGQLELRGRV